MEHPLDNSALFAMAYEAIKADARRIASAGDGHNSPTTLVHEAWLRLEKHQCSFESEAHFRAVSAMAMRQILIDQARHRAALKRGGGQYHTTISGLGVAPRLDILDLDMALRRLEERDVRQGQIAMLRLFGGLSAGEVAAELDMSERSVQRHWRVARAWLQKELA